MILLDDLFVRPLVGFLDVIHSMAMEEMYDVESIRDELKETHLLYEIGELSDSEYEERKTELEANLEAAEAAREHLRESRVEVKRG